MMNFASVVLVGLLVAVGAGMVACMVWIGMAFVWPTRRNTQSFNNPEQSAQARRSEHKGMS